MKRWHDEHHRVYDDTSLSWIYDTRVVVSTYVCKQLCSDVLVHSAHFSRKYETTIIGSD